MWHEIWPGVIITSRSAIAVRVVAKKDVPAKSPIGGVHAEALRRIG